MKGYLTPVIQASKPKKLSPRKIRHPREELSHYGLCP
jgi:hypothetical protein